MLPWTGFGHVVSPPGHSGHPVAEPQVSPFRPSSLDKAWGSWSTGGPQAALGKLRTWGRGDTHHRWGWAVANLHLRALRLLTQPCLWRPRQRPVDAGYQSEAPLVAHAGCGCGALFGRPEGTRQEHSHTPHHDPEKPPGSTRQEENGGRLASCHFNVANS